MLYDNTVTMPGRVVPWFACARQSGIALGQRDNCGNPRHGGRSFPSDIIIIAAFASMSEEEADSFKPKLVYVDGKNQISHTNDTIPTQAA